MNSVLAFTADRELVITWASEPLLATGLKAGMLVGSGPGIPPEVAARYIKAACLAMRMNEEVEYHEQWSRTTNLIIPRASGFLGLFRPEAQSDEDWLVSMARLQSSPLAVAAFSVDTR